MGKNKYGTLHLAVQCGTSLLVWIGIVYSAASAPPWSALFLRNTKHICLHRSCHSVGAQKFAHSFTSPSLKANLLTLSQTYRRRMHTNCKVHHFQKNKLRKLPFRFILSTWEDHPSGAERSSTVFIPMQDNLLVLKVEICN